MSRGDSYSDRVIPPKPLLYPHADGSPVFWKWPPDPIVAAVDEAVDRLSDPVVIDGMVMSRAVAKAYLAHPTIKGRSS